MNWAHLLIYYENKRLRRWARPIWLFPLVNPYRKSTPGGRWCSPLQAMPAHNKALCTDSKSNQTSKTSTAEAFPFPPFCYAFPVLLFLAFCIDRTGRAFNRIAFTCNYKSIIAYKQHTQQKQTENRRTRQKSKSKGKREAYNIKQYTHTKASEKKSK